MLPNGTMTKVGAAGIILATVGKVLTDLANGDLAWDQVPGYVTAISAALAVLGIRRAVGRAAGEE